MHDLREIWLRHAKCAAAHEGIYFISHRTELWRREIFHNFRKKIISHSASPNISLERIMVLCYNLVGAIILILFVIAAFVSFDFKIL